MPVVNTILKILFPLAALANWDTAWLKNSIPQWQLKSPSASDPVGVSIYCGFDYSSQRTQIHLSLQNRTDKALCLNTKQSILIAAADGKKIQDSMPARHMRFLKVKPIKLHREVSLSFKCRSLKFNESILPDFAFDENGADCAKASHRIGPSDITEVSIEFLVPYIDIEQFEIKVPVDCETGEKIMDDFKFKCLRPGS